MQEPSLHSSRIALAAGLAALLIVGGAGFFLGRSTTERAPEPALPPAAAAPKPAAEPEPEPQPNILGRADLIALAAAAADAAASGRALASDIRELEGRRFELRLPFGCNGPASPGSNAAMRWTYDAAESALRIHVAPFTWAANAWWTGDAPAGVEAVEGFWITRPWTSSEECPAAHQPAATGAEPVTLPGQTLAIGRILSGEAREGQRAGNLYQAVMRVPENELDASRGFRLRVSGRIASVPGSGPLHCQQPAGPEQRPICLVAVTMDEVAIENPAKEEVLATWTVGQREAPTG
jgi:hypothetical protein